jgi:hypothetical protein
MPTENRATTAANSGNAGVRCRVGEVEREPRQQHAGDDGERVAATPQQQRGGDEHAREPQPGRVEAVARDVGHADGCDDEREGDVDEPCHRPTVVRRDHSERRPDGRFADRPCGRRRGREAAIASPP